MDIYLGIDFGAENIMVSYKVDDNSEIYDLEFNGKNHLKNCYALRDKEEYFGDEAIDEFLEFNNTNGFVFIDKYKQDLIKTDEKIDKSKYEKLKPKQILVKMLTRIKSEIENHLKTNRKIENFNLANTVITIPVAWKLKPDIIQVYKLAMQQAGFKKFQIESEPVAAAADIISTSVTNYESLGLEKAPEVSDTILLVDIGASTLDVNLCTYAKPICTEVGNGNEFAGNYFDALVCSKSKKSFLDKLLSFRNEYFDELLDFKDIKESPRKIAKELRNNTPLGKEIKIATSKYIDTVAKSIQKIVQEIIRNSVHKQIDYFVVCGGMSQYNGENFLERLFQKSQELSPEIFENTILINKNNKSKSLLYEAIVHGATLLAKEPQLVTKNLPYHLGIIIITEEETSTEKNVTRNPVVLLKKGTPLKHTTEKYSLRDSLIEIGLIKNLSSRLRTEMFTNKKEPIEIFLADTDEEIDKFRFGDSPTEIIDFILTNNYDKEMVKDLNLDMLFYIDKNNIINFDIVDIRNEKSLVAKGKFQKFIEVEKTLDIRI
jgi:hypothetical protein